MKRMPLRGEIWYVKLPTDPPDKAPRPVIVISLDARNRHPGASTVLVSSLTGSVEKDFETHIKLSPGETGLHASSIRCENLRARHISNCAWTEFPADSGNTRES